MKILMINSFNYMRGGAERCFIDLTDLLTAHGHEVIPFCMSHERNRPSPYASYFVSYVDFPSLLNGNGSRLKNTFTAFERVVYNREARQNVERLIADTKPDIAHVHGIAHEISPSILPALKKAGVPVVQTLHDYKLLCPNTNFVAQEAVCERCKGHRYYNVVRYRCKRDSTAASVLAAVETTVHKIMQIYEHNVDLFISPSAFLKQKVAEFGIKNPVINIPNFINVKEIQPCFEPDNYFLFFGRLVNTKGVMTLLKAMEQVKRSHLYIAGTGDLEQSLRQYAEERGITNVTFLGFVHTEKLIPLIQKAAFTVVPSEWYENYSMSVLESLAAGKPIVGANIGGIPEQVNDGYNGLLFEPGNVAQLAEKINYLLDNPDEAVKMGQNSRRQVETINHPETHYQQTMQVYSSLLK